MTDEQIIKALECCRDCKCKDCPCYNKETDGCKELDEQDILDLINRQKSEIERLKDEKLKCFLAYEKDRKRVKSEAYKEFAERLKTKFHTAMSFSFVHIHEVIDNLVKEMTEGNGNGKT